MSPHHEPKPPINASSGERLQKVLAAAGVGSRRSCEELIAAGRVSVNGDVVRTQGLRVDPANAIIHVDGKRINVRPDAVYVALHKPRGVLSAMSDDRGRPTVGDYVADQTERLFHVGRLDQDSEGLLLLTNDGELAHRLSHPSYEVSKTYLAEVEGPLPKGLGQVLRRGVQLEDGIAVVDRFRTVDSVGERVLVEVVLHEGRKRIVRRLFAHVDHPVVRLVRTAIGPITLGNQRPGTVRALSPQEVSDLYGAVKL